MLSTEISSKQTKQKDPETKDNFCIRQAIKRCFGEIESNEKYLISIQGCSSSGKSTIAKNIHNMLVKNNVEVFLLNLDSYYKTFTHNNLHEYDFDNPAALDWEKIDKVLKAISEDNEVIPTYKYSFITKRSEGPIYIKNKKPQIVIVEGIYAFNPINDYRFNAKEFDPLKTSKFIGKEFIKNKAQLNFKMLKVMLSMCKSKSMEVRIERDIRQRNKSREDGLRQFENQTWPATCKWVNNVVFVEDIKIVHGSFNEEKVFTLIEEVTKYFTKDAVCLDNVLYESNLMECFSVVCSGECERETML